MNIRWRGQRLRTLLGCASKLFLALGVLSCGANPRELVLASTTSTDDSGLFDHLLPAFREAHPEYGVSVLAVGSGQALALAKRGDADVVLVHSPKAEEQFMAEGHGESRRPVMFNDFVIVGPRADPAGVRGLMDGAGALGRIAGADAPFISRGDDSGTHNKERELWSVAGLEPQGGWYWEVGQGMGNVLMMASELDAYTLTDRGTYLSMSNVLGLTVLVEGDPALRNQYSVITASEAANLDGARAFADWITSPAAQTLIDGFGVEAFGRSLFTPNAEPFQPGSMLMERRARSRSATLFGAYPRITRAFVVLGRSTRSVGDTRCLAAGDGGVCA